jgi:prolyl-tRNA editing enzyme YbaK/EbsC (Cys-tRNA(Pro) deacylase)
MSNSLERVTSILKAAGASFEMRHLTEDTHTAHQTAEAIGCHVNQIAKSIIAQGYESDTLFLFLTSGGAQIDPEKAAELCDEPILRPGADFVHALTGFDAGAVAPCGALTPLKTFIDPALLEYDLIWAAGGTPRAVFSVSPAHLQSISQATMVDFTDQ